MKPNRHSDLRFSGGPRRALFVVGFALVAGCGTTDPGMSDFQELVRNRSRWEQTGPDTYRYAVRRDCFCGEAARGPVRVTVIGGSVPERVYVDSGEAVPAELTALFPTVDGLFDALVDAYERDAFRVDVEYDPGTGVPVSIFMDYQENVADEELGFAVTEMPGPVPFLASPGAR